MPVPSPWSYSVTQWPRSGAEFPGEVGRVTREEMTVDIDAGRRHHATLAYGRLTNSPSFVRLPAASSPICASAGRLTSRRHQRRHRTAERRIEPCVAIRRSGGHHRRTVGAALQGAAVASATAGQAVPQQSQGLPLATALMLSITGARRFSSEERVCCRPPRHTGLPRLNQSAQRKVGLKNTGLVHRRAPSRLAASTGRSSTGASSRFYATTAADVSLWATASTSLWSNAAH